MVMPTAQATASAISSGVNTLVQDAEEALRAARDRAGGLP
jgi:hypothetical protein